MSAKIATVSTGSEIKFHKAIVVAKGDTFENALLNSAFAKEAINLLLKAVDNRTIERDYFRLYCDLLDGTLSEEEFDRQVNEHPNEYIVSEDVDPDLNSIQVALELSKRIRNVRTVEDFASLFSFNQLVLKKLMADD